MKEKNNNSCPFSDRLGKVGGQAVLEGVMMKAGNRMVTTCRKEDGSLVVTDDNFVSARQKHKILDLPIIRGVVSFVESMMMSFKTLGASADAMGLENEEEPSKFEKWLSDKFGAKITDVIMVVSLVLGLALSALLFVALPAFVTWGINSILDALFFLVMPDFVQAVVEGLVKIAIFVGYLAAVSLMPDIKRTFMYHGAEHKSIACFEAGEELTPENAKKHTRFHPRCGTSFMFVMILLGIFAGLLIRVSDVADNVVVYTLIKLAILPILMGLGYEFIRYAGKHPSKFTAALSAPGLWMQRITTKEPDEGMLEVAITSLKCSLRDEYPEFKEFFEARPWEPKAETAENGENGDCPEEAETNDVVSEKDAPFTAESVTKVDENTIVAESHATEDGEAKEENDA